MLKLFYISLILFVFSCSSNQQNKNIVAKVYDKALSYDDFKFLFKNKSLSIKDSTTLAKEFIENWVNEQVIIHQLNKSSNINIDDINYKANHYKNMLIIHQLENNYINKNLDTTILHNEYVTYYKDHKNDFQLSDYLVKVLYIKVALDAPDLNKLSQWYKLYNSDDITKIEAFANQYAANFYYDTENWIYFDDLTKEIPLKDLNKDKFITRKSYKKIEENGYFYFLNVIDYKLKNSASPLEFEKENIKQRILNIRIKELREKYKNDNITKANNEKSVHIY